MGKVPSDMKTRTYLQRNPEAGQACKACNLSARQIVSEARSSDRSVEATLAAATKRGAPSVGMPA